MSILSITTVSTFFLESPTAEWAVFGVIAALVAVALFALMPLIYGGGRRRAWCLTFIGSLVAIGATSAFAPKRPEPGSLEDPEARGRPVQAEELGYESSDTCRTCHPREYATWHRSYHRTMTQVVSPETMLADWDTTLEIRGLEYHLYREADEYWVDMADPEYGERGRDLYGNFVQGDNETKRVKKRAVVSTGSHHQQVYWFSAEKGRTLFLFPFTWMINEARWIPYEESFLRPAYQRGTTELWNEVCITCHSTGHQPRFAGEGIESDTRLGEYGIACEACHGPGEEHIRANQSPLRRYRQHLAGGGDPTIVNPADVSAARANQICGQCHAVMGLPPELDEEWRHSGYRYRPGDDLRETRIIALRPDRELEGPLRFIADQFSWEDGMVRASGRDYNGMLESECASGGELSCLSCHTMHHKSEDPRSIDIWADDQLSIGMEGDKACLQCHESIGPAIEAHTRHEAESSGSRCYNCHMPHTTYGLLKAIRSHTFGRSPSVRESVEYGRPNACNLCHLDKSLGWTERHLADWYGHPEENQMAEEEKNRSAALLWLMRGDPVQRVLAGWHMGWAPAVEASGSDWMPPFLALTLNDPYAGIRFIGERSLRRIAGFDAFAYDYVAPDRERESVTNEVMAEWRGMHPLKTFESRKHLFFDDAGEFDVRAVKDVLKRRDKRQVHISE